ncbi:hypothetical protein CBL_05857 [Carabus blaptoides fortunei]
MIPNPQCGKLESYLMLLYGLVLAMLSVSAAGSRRELISHSSKVEQGEAVEGPFRGSTWSICQGTAATRFTLTDMRHHKVITITLRQPRETHEPVKVFIQGDLYSIVLTQCSFS